MLAGTLTVMDEPLAEAIGAAVVRRRRGRRKARQSPHESFLGSEIMVVLTVSLELELGSDLKEIVRTRGRRRGSSWMLK